MGRLLKEMFGVGPRRVTEVTVNVPDEDMPGLQKAVLAAIKAGDLPKTATKWARSADSAAADAAKQAKKDKGKDRPEVPAPNKADPKPSPARDKAGEPEEPVSPTAKTVASMPAVKPNVATNKGRSVPATNRFAGRNGDEEPFPDLGAPRSATTSVDPDDDGEYRSPFGHLGFGQSSWDAVPGYMRDPEMMPHASGGSQRVPGSRDREDQPAYKGPSPKGRPWTDKDVKSMGPTKPGMLSRLFGRKAK